MDPKTLENLKKYHHYLSQELKKYDWIDHQDDKEKAASLRAKSILTCARMELTSLFPEIKEEIFTENH